MVHTERERNSSLGYEVQCHALGLSQVFKSFSQGVVNQRHLLLMFTILGLRPRDTAAILDGHKLQFILAEFADRRDVRYKPSITNCYFFCFTPRFSPELTMCSILHA